MTSHDPAQDEADYLLGLEKRRIDDTEWVYPGAGGGLSIPLVSLDGREQFMLDIRRGRINVAKGSYQNRARTIIILARLCFGGNPHDNPDGTTVGSPHLHRYREGFGDKWASELPTEFSASLINPADLLPDFQRYCRIVEPPLIKRQLSL